MAIGSEKFNAEEHGFDGFGLWLEIIKARSNQAGQKVHLIYDKVRGIDPVRSNIAFAKDIGLVGGNKNKTYFINNPEFKFEMATVNDYFRENREMYKVMYNHIIPVLQTKLSAVKKEETEVIPELMDY